MVKRKSVKKSSLKVVRKPSPIINVKPEISEFEKPVGKPWFRKRRGLFSPDLGWGWVPITWQGYLAVLLLIVVNVFSVFYFDLALGGSDSVIKFLTVLALSLLVFSLFAIKRTRK